MPDTNRIARYERRWTLPNARWLRSSTDIPITFRSTRQRAGGTMRGELWTDWTGGFLVGMMWQFHRRTGSPAWRERAQHYAQLLEYRKHDRKVHDLGFVFLNAYLPWYELTGDRQLLAVIVEAGRTLAERFQPHGQIPVQLRCAGIAVHRHHDERAVDPICGEQDTRPGPCADRRRPLPHDARLPGAPGWLSRS